MLPEQKPFCSLPLVLGFPPESKTLSPSFQPAPFPRSLYLTWDHSLARTLSSEICRVPTQLPGTAWNQHFPRHL